LRLEPREQPLGYDKSTYDVFIDDVLRAHVGIANGWGEKWYLAKVGDPDEARHWTNGRHGGRVSGSVIDYFEANAWLNGSHNAPESIIFWPVHYTARDAMACAALAYWDKYGVQGLPTVEEAKAAKEAKREADAQEAKEREARRIEREKERDLEDKARAERRTTWGAALAELEARGDLTNLERAGLQAIKALYPMG
jgi:hypothetical protein